MIVVLLGAPGAGKGTQAKAICENFDMSHVSTGDILRNEIKKGTELGKKVAGFVESGKLVPDDVIIEIIKKRIGEDRSEKGFLMDGFPRNLKQAKMFREMLDELGIKLDTVINIVVDKDEIIERLSNRRICSGCKSIFSANEDGKILTECPKCGAQLVIRKDDEPEVIRHRLEVYESETRPLIDFYEAGGILVNIDGSGDKDKITERILQVL